MRVDCQRSYQERIVAFRFLSVCLAFLLLGPPLLLRAQEGDGGATVTNDSGRQTILQSIAVPPLPGAPFSLTLAAEWARSMT